MPCGGSIWLLKHWMVRVAGRPGCRRTRKGAFEMDADFTSSLHQRTRRRRIAAAALSSVAAVGLLAGVLATPPAFSAPNQPPANASVSNLQFEQGYADLVEAIKPAVVNVKVERTDAGDDEDAGPQQGQ